MTAEGIDLPIDVASPEFFAGPLSAALVVETNGGTRRIKVVPEPPAPTGEAFEVEPPTSLEPSLSDHLSRISVSTRLIASGLSAAGLRLLIALVAGSSPPGSGPDQRGAYPGRPQRRQSRGPLARDLARDVLACGFAGAEAPRRITASAIAFRSAGSPVPTCFPGTPAW